MKIEQRTRKTIRIKPSIFQRAKRMARKHGTHVYYLIETQLDQCLAVLERQEKRRRSVASDPPAGIAELALEAAK